MSSILDVIQPHVSNWKEPPMKVIFLCTANSARSIVAEALFRDMVGNTHEVYSCGAAPSGHVNSNALAYLSQRNISTQGLQSKSYNDVPMENSLLVAVCDNAAKEICPVAAGGAHRINMPLPDPGAPDLPDHEQQKLFVDVGQQLQSLLQNLKEQIESVNSIREIVSPQTTLTKLV